MRLLPLILILAEQTCVFHHVGDGGDDNGDDDGDDDDDDDDDVLNYLENDHQT